MAVPIYETDGGGEWRLYVGTSIAATAAVAVVGTFALHADTEDHFWRPEVWSESEVTRNEVQQQPLREGHVEHNTVTVQTKQPTEAQRDFKFKTGRSPLAREYAEDPAAIEVDQSAGSQINETIADMRREGWQNFTLTLQGRASAEDDTKLPDGGLSTDNNRQIALAQKRQDSFTKYLETTHLPNDVKIIQDKPLEQKLDPNKEEDKKQLKILEDMAELYGYENTGAMIEAWDAHQPVPPAVESSLTALLGDFRGVAVAIKAEKPGEEKTVNSTKEVATCIIPVREITTIYEKSKPWQLPVPKFFLLPIPIVWYRRAGNTDGLDIEWPDMPDINLLPSEGVFVGGSDGEIVPPADDEPEPAPGPDKPLPPNTPKPPLGEGLRTLGRDAKELGCSSGCWKFAGAVLVGAAFVGLAGWGLSKCEFTPPGPPTPSSIKPGEEPCPPNMPTENRPEVTITRYSRDSAPRQ
jgi:hypothetical protein